MKFEKGQKVKVVSGSVGKGSSGRIKEVNEDFCFPYKVKFDPNQGHSFVWNWYNDNELEAVK